MLLALLLSAAAAPAADTPPSLALPGFNAVRLEKGEAELYAELLSQQLQRFGFKVMTSRDLSAVMGLERQRELMGCGDSSCLTEMVGALGVDGVLLGDVGLLGDEYTVSVKVLSTKNGEALALHTGRALSAKAMPAELAAAARDVAHQLSVWWNRPELEPRAEVARPTATVAPREPSTWALAPVIIGGLALITGIVLEVLASAEFDRLMTAPTEGAARAAAGNGKTYETAGWLLVAGGSACALAGAATFIYSLLPQRRVRPRVVLAPGVVGFGLAGELP
ncbi:MAG: hypothetical protein IPJ65_22830 [Archangiaceae bacterium]|nr:hypothetical protein [Archangiaceae bacterium]